MRQVPRLAARDERDDLQQRGDGEHPAGGAPERVDELVALAGEQEDEDRRRRQRADDRDQRAPAIGVASAARLARHRRHGRERHAACLVDGRERLVVLLGGHGGFRPGERQIACEERDETVGTIFGPFLLAGTKNGPFAESGRVACGAITVQRTVLPDDRRMGRGDRRSQRLGFGDDRSHLEGRRSSRGRRCVRRLHRRDGPGGLRRHPGQPRRVDAAPRRWRPDRVHHLLLLGLAGRDPRLRRRRRRDRGLLPRGRPLSRRARSDRQALRGRRQRRAHPAG